MELNEEQKTALTHWVAEGTGLSDIQKRLRETFGLNLTYMDVRFLVLDLGLTLRDRAEAAAPPLPPAADDDAMDLSAANPAPAIGQVSVSLDRIVKPGAVVSGSVTFSDGRHATWMLDQLGRLALDAGDPGYRPSEADVQEFQHALQRALQSQGL